MIPQFLLPAGRELLENEYITGLDIGGACGLQPHWNRFVGNAHLYMFEPHEKSFRELQDSFRTHPFESLFHILPYALAERDGPTKFYATNAPTGSSLLKPNTKWKFHSPSDPYYYPMQVLDIDAVSLKTALDRGGVPDIDIIKMDIQGPELAVLRGLDQARLDRTLLVELEVLFEPFYENSSRLPDVETFMTQNGFEMFDMRVSRSARKVPSLGETYNERVFGVGVRDPSIAQKIGEIDCVYFRKYEPLIARRDVSKLNKLIFTYCVYNFFADAMMVIDEMFVNGLTTRVRHDRVRELVIQWQGMNKESLRHLDKVLELFQHQNYGQYMWMPYPSS